jgi:hypothetical protein
MKTLLLFYIECRLISGMLLKSYLEGKKIAFPMDKILEYTHDASTRLLERFIVDPTYRVKSFRGILWHEIQYQLFGMNNKKIKEEQKLVSLDETHNIIPAPVKDALEPLDDSLQEILRNHPNGKKIIVFLKSSKSFTTAIRKIEKLASRKWIRDNSREIYHTFKVLHYRGNK